MAAPMVTEPGKMDSRGAVTLLVCFVQHIMNISFGFINNVLVT